MEARRRRRRDERRRRENRGAVGAEGEGNGEGCPLPNLLWGLGSVVSSPSGVRGGARPKTNLVHFVDARRPLIAIICLICFIKHRSCSLSLLF